MTPADPQPLEEQHDLTPLTPSHLTPADPKPFEGQHDLTPADP